MRIIFIVNMNFQARQYFLFCLRAAGIFSSDYQHLIGISYFPLATCGNDIDSIVRSIRYTVKLAGIEHVGIGSDYDGAVSVPFDTAGMALLVSLLKDGFTENEIRLIMGGNVLRLLKELLPPK